ncbi:MAG: phosphopentomutase [Candidatus Melainabacteria bacterium RIFOXYA12_FULL_32_12]|nr:MAG: phosphopentomutase [Candidatus Melainabacteria bacterium RIFOXYA2_FULL_32_9]OGI27773.1 MAG: phosphopentomutase [Candidatus Melainabacteria bacterium RIFOXYA12_FULL_32_12]
MKRAIIVVIDALGVGAMPDAPKYGDLLDCNTLVNVAKFNKGLNLPNFERLGLGNIDRIEGVNPTDKPLAGFGKMLEVSEGKDTTTGHWEMAGLILEEGFRTYPDGFSSELIEEFIEKTGCKAILGNYPASGTAIINELGDAHIETKYPIIYTSADSVFQIACHVGVIPLDTLYEWCIIAREILDKGYNISRVIARPFEGVSGDYKRVSAARRDYSVPPIGSTILNKIVENNGRVIGIGKIEDIFVKSGITHAVHTGSNLEGLKLTLQAIRNELNLGEIAINPEKITKNSDKDLIFTNLVDTDMLYGHRNDPVGYGNALKEIDSYLTDIINSVTDKDLLIITADHGCDPTTPGTDHTREQVPVLIYNPIIEGHNLGVRETFADIAATVTEWTGIAYDGPGKSML